MFQIDDKTISYTDLCKEVGIRNAYQISELTPPQRKFLFERLDIYGDYLIHVDSESFTVNHENVGNNGVTYRFP